MPDDREPRTRRAHGEDILVAHAYGNDLPGLRMDALDHARRLFGPEAVLQVESVENITTAFSKSRGAFTATIIVRRVDGGEEWVPPMGGTDA